MLTPLEVCSIFVGLAGEEKWFVRLKVRRRTHSLQGKVHCKECMKLQYKGSKRKIAFRVTGSPSRRRKTKYFIPVEAR